MKAVLLFMAIFCATLSIQAQNPANNAPKFPLKATLLRNFVGHQGSKVEYVTFNATGDKVATAGFDGLIHVIDVRNNTEGAKVLSGHKGTVNHVVFNKSSTLLASAGNDGFIKVWDLASGTLLYEFMNAPTSALYREAYVVLFSPDEHYLYFGGKNSRIQRVALSPDAKPETVYTDNYYITSAIISPDSRYMIFSCAYEVMQLDFNTNKVSPRKFTGSDDFVNDIQISSDGKNLAAWTENGNIKIWDYATAKPKTTFKGGNKNYSHLSFSKDGRYIASGNAVGAGFKLFDAQTQKTVLHNTEHQGSVRAIQFSPTDNDMLLTGGHDGSVRIWKIEPNEIVPIEPPVVPLPPAPTAVQPTTPAPAPKNAIQFNDKNLPTAINNRKVNIKANIPVRATHLNLEIFDDEQEDGDVITLYMNDDLILEKYSLTKQKKVIPIEIKPDEPNVMILYAVNMGKNPPATVAIRILDGIFPQMINLSADPKESQAFSIYLKK
jgi:WD40 repeat protein